MYHHVRDTHAAQETRLAALVGAGDDDEVFPIGDQIVGSRRCCQAFPERQRRVVQVPELQAPFQPLRRARGKRSGCPATPTGHGGSGSRCRKPAPCAAFLKEAEDVVGRLRHVLASRGLMPRSRTRRMRALPFVALSMVKPVFRCSLWPSRRPNQLGRFSLCRRM